MQTDARLELQIKSFPGEAGGETVDTTCPLALQAGEADPDEVLR